MLSNMRLCSNVPAQSIVQTCLGGIQRSQGLLVPGGRIYEQREYVYERLSNMDGVTVTKPEAAFYIFPRLDPDKFHITDDDQFALDLLKDEHVLITAGKGFNWEKPGYFRIVYLPRRAHAARGDGQARGLPELLPAVREVTRVMRPRRRFPRRAWAYRGDRSVIG